MKIETSEDKKKSADRTKAVNQFNALIIMHCIYRNLCSRQENSLHITFITIQKFINKMKN